MIRYVAKLLLCLVLAGPLGCASAGAWRYPQSRATPGEVVSETRVAVLPFQDRRTGGNSNRMLLYIIPLVPVGPIHYNRIEGGSGFLYHSSYNVRPADDLAKALVSDLKRARVFREVFFTNRENEPGIDYVLQGYVSEMKYKGGVISYGLSFYGPLLWLLGLPAGYTTNTLRVGLDLHAQDSGDVVWSSIGKRGEREVTSGLYYNWGTEFDGYPEIAREINQQWIAGLTQYFSQPRDSLWKRAPVPIAPVARMDRPGRIAPDAPAAGVRRGLPAAISGSP